METSAANLPDFIYPTPVPPRTGSERFVGGLDAFLIDLWRWAFSDLKANVIRAIVAEFIVARAVGDPTPFRNPWGNHDVTSQEGFRLQVKSSAYLQAWPQRHLSKPGFSGLKARSWDPLYGYGPERTTRADVFVFALQTALNHEHYDVFDVRQWDFWVVPAQVIEKLTSDSIGLSFLAAWDKRSWGDLRDAVKQVGSTQKLPG